MDDREYRAYEAWLIAKSDLYGAELRGDREAISQLEREVASARSQFNRVSDHSSSDMEAAWNQGKSYNRRTRRAHDPHDFE